MAIQHLVGSEMACNVELRAGQHWVRLSLWLATEFRGGELVRIDDEAAVSIEGTDELAATYTPTNWLSGVCSGALFAFRTLQLPRQKVSLTELSGRLGSHDMEMVANASALAVAKLAARDLPGLNADGWVGQSLLMDRRKSLVLKETVPSNGDLSVEQRPLSNEPPLPNS